MHRQRSAGRHPNQWRMTNSRRAQGLRLAATIVTSLCSLTLLALGIAAWSMPETEEVHVRPGATVHLHRSPPLSEGQAVFVSKSVNSTALRSGSVLSCSLTRESTRTKLGARADPSIGERARENTALRPLWKIGTTKGTETVRCSGSAVDAGAVWIMPVRVGVPFRALVVTLAGIGLLGLALLIHFGRLLAREG